MNRNPDLKHGLAVVIDARDDAAFTHTALAAHAPRAGRLTLHPGPGTTSDTALAQDLLLALGKPAHIPGRFPKGRPPLWEATAAWTIALAVTRLTVLRAHLLDERRLQRILSLGRQTGVHLTFVVHRPRLTAALERALPADGYTTAHTLGEARALYQGDDTAEGVAPLIPPASLAAWRWITLAALNRLVSYDSPQACTTACSPRPIVYLQRPAPLVPTPAQSVGLAARLHAASAHPARAAALAGAVATGASFQQLTTARADGFHCADSTLTLHDRTRYTDGCAIYPVPAWAVPFLHAAAQFAHLTGTPHLLAAPTDRPALLRLAETIKIRPPQPRASQAGAQRDPVVWDWAEKIEALG
ncbi:hypothetical protein OG264_38415 [Streptomyces xanthophaeus]|uniref:hypothetical protein n=1 Tax=Streptomyces xanthophaeus TaxID=67385 RepID=UPI003865B3A5|nr:hypothetical protein OG264_00020 [Streptomyces xanthophaeus]WST26865.1 hypothetical protein OG264_38415 [Streptomyces xanthophaeus]